MIGRSSIRDIVETSIRHRSDRAVYRDGAVERIVQRVMFVDKTDKETVIKELEKAIEEEEIYYDDESSPWFHLAVMGEQV